MNSFEMSNICSIFWNVLKVTIDMVLVPSLIHPAPIFNFFKNWWKPSGFLLVCVVPDEHQVVPLQAGVSLDLGLFWNCGSCIGNLNTFSGMTRKLPIMERTLDAITTNSTTNTYICTQMRTVGICYEHFTRVTSEDCKVHSKSINLLNLSSIQFSAL